MWKSSLYVSVRINMHNWKSFCLLLLPLLFILGSFCWALFVFLISYVICSAWSVNKIMWLFSSAPLYYSFNLPFLYAVLITLDNLNRNQGKWYTKNNAHILKRKKCQRKYRFVCDDDARSKHLYFAIEKHIVHIVYMRAPATKTTSHAKYYLEKKRKQNERKRKKYFLQMLSE